MIDLTPSPRDYGLPSDTWYPNQPQMVEAAVNVPKGHTLIIESPPGNGKSFCPAVASYYRPGTVAITHTRDLQAQYASTIPFFNVVWGQEHYKCILPWRVIDFERTYGFTPNRKHCYYDFPKGKCDEFEDCPYECAKIDARDGRATVLNVAYAFYTQWWREKKKEKTWDLFIDEAHRIPEALSELISITIGRYVRQWYGLPKFPDIIERGEKRRKAILLSLEWLEDAISVMERWCKKEADEVRLERGKRFLSGMRLLESVLTEAEPGTWYIQSNSELFSAKPVIPGIYAKMLITSRARSLTFMSATIGDPDVLLAELGLDTVPHQFLSLPHAFPQENRPVFWLRDAPRIRNKTTDTEYAYQAQLISKIIQQHRGEKGLIHTASWHHAKMLMERLTSNGVGDRMMLTDGKRIEAVERFKHSDNGTVAVSPSWREGLNFPDDECRFSVIAKVPFLSLADVIVRMRLARKGGNAWYKWKAALQVVQAAGRGVRHSDDWCITYLADGTFPQVAPYTPKWFRVEAL